MAANLSFFYMHVNYPLCVIRIYKIQKNFQARIRRREPINTHLKK